MLYEILYFRWIFYEIFFLLLLFARLKMMYIKFIAFIVYLLNNFIKCSMEFDFYISECDSNLKQNLISWSYISSMFKIFHFIFLPKKIYIYISLYQDLISIIFPFQNKLRKKSYKYVIWNLHITIRLQQCFHVFCGKRAIWLQRFNPK